MKRGCLATFTLLKLPIAKKKLERETSVYCVAKPRSYSQTAEENR